MSCQKDLVRRSNGLCGSYFINIYIVQVGEVIHVVVVDFLINVNFIFLTYGRYFFKIVEVELYFIMTRTEVKQLQIYHSICDYVALRI